MTEFEDITIKPLINSGTIKFYKRYVDDTLILTKPSDIPYIFAKFNSFHPSIQFTIDDFNDNDIHFLDIQIHSSGTSVYRKPTHTGQYQHISSFSPWLAHKIFRETLALQCNCWWTNKLNHLPLFLPQKEVDHLLVSTS